MPLFVNKDASFYVAREGEVFSNGKDGTTPENASATITRSPDIGTAADTAAVDLTGSKTLIQVIKGLFNKIPGLGQSTMASSLPVAIASNQSAIPASQSGTWNVNNVSGTVSLPTGAATDTSLIAVRDRLPSALVGGKLSVDVAFPTTQQISIASNQSVQISSVPVQQGAGVVTGTTQRVVAASDSPDVTTLASVLNALTLATPVSQTITFTIGNGASLSSYQQLVGRSWLIFFPAMIGANVKVRVKKVSGDATGDLLYDDTGNPHELFVSSTARAYSAQATAFLSSCIESFIAFESYSDATTVVNQTSAITITLKAVV